MTHIRRIVNTAPLIFLSNLERLELLRLGAREVFVPSGVLAELRARSDYAQKSVDAIVGKWLIERTCTNSHAVSLALQSIDRGEAEVVALALELRTTAVVLDDMDGRRYARRLGLQPIGTLGLLLAAKQNQLIPAIQPEIERLVSMGFRASGSLIQKVLVAAGESLHA